MKIVLFTALLPTPDNYGGASALMYHLMKNRENNIDLLIVSLNDNNVNKDSINQISKELKATIIATPRTFFDKVKMYSKLNRVLNCFRKARIDNAAYYKLPKSLIIKIDKFKPDLIWIYPCSFLGVVHQMKSYPILACGCDCEALHISRLLRDSYVIDKKLFKEELYKYQTKFNNIIKWNTIPNAHIHLVGKTDEEYFKLIAPNAKVKFFQHPHYNLNNKTIDFNKNILKVIISGNFNLYTYSDTIKMIEAFCLCNSNVLRQNINFSFLGKNWEQHINKLNEYGYSAKKQGWVESYVEYIKDFDIQIFPISIGTGTKGKVLDALSTGLLCIGSQYAFENIAVKPNKSCVLYNKAEEIPALLENVFENKSYYENIAKHGKENVRYYHNPEYITKEILDWCKTDNYHINLEHFHILPLKS